LIDTFENNIDLYVKNESQIHPEFGGNKWRKLKYNLQNYFDRKHDHIVTFGGAFSNHIAATAAVCHSLKIPCTGIIRGTYEDENNPTLLRAKSNGMSIHHITKEAYKLKEHSQEFRSIISTFEKPLILPEGGSNDLAKKGVHEVIDEITDQDFDNIILPSGTGMTTSGIIEQAPKTMHVIGVNVLKNKSLDEMVSSNLDNSDCSWEINHDYHFGGYAKVSDKLQSFAQEFYDKYDLVLDPIYNSKMMYGILDMIKHGKFRDRSKLLAINTGGLQGVRGYEYVNKKIWVKT
ncbi:MAG: pyridoxal-phosphate dependent enzyme, partial [Saprospiraceae bacterium]|nr:pyridoxal-phosphate dependent enzyme [Saprospiraceae bacterium]